MKLYFIVDQIAYVSTMGQILPVKVLKSDGFEVRVRTELGKLMSFKPDGSELSNGDRRTRLFQKRPIYELTTYPNVLQEVPDVKPSPEEIYKTLEKPCYKFQAMFSGGIVLKFEEKPEIKDKVWMVKKGEVCVIGKVQDPKMWKYWEDSLIEI